MSNLSSQLAALKRNRTTKSITHAAGCSRETFRRIERGDSVKLSTLKSIAKALDATDSQWIELVAAWAKHELETELGNQSRKITVEVNELQTLRDAKPSQATQAMMLFDRLPNEHRVHIIKTMSRPEVIRMLPSIHAMYDDLHPETKSPPRGK